MPIAGGKSAPRRGLLALAVIVALVLAVGLAGTASAEEAPLRPPAPPAPANDRLADAQVIRAFPTTIQGTTVGATQEFPQVESGCHVETTSSVWYTLRLTAAHRIAINLAAAGALEATVDVYHVVRSQLAPVTCQQTDAEGKASLSFSASKNGLYDIRVAARRGSQQNSFTMEAFLPTPAVAPPGPALSRGGVSGLVDRIQNVNAAYSFAMHSGESYIINLANETKGACVSGTLFAPGTKSFGAEEEGEGEGSSAGLLHIRCSGYRLFTPGPGEGGLYSFEITPRLSYRGRQRFHLQVAPAGPAETAPGLTLENDERARGYLDGRGVEVLRLYRMEIKSHSNLTLALSAPPSVEFKLELVNQDGDVIECECNGSGSVKLTHQLVPGTYYAVVAERNGAAGSYTLLRESRTITSTSISFSTKTDAPGEPDAIDVKVSPAESGPVHVRIERFDPVFGWQFYGEVDTSASAGLAVVPFTPPAVGMWRAKANYEGSLTASPSAVGNTYMLVR